MDNVAQIIAAVTGFVAALFAGYVAIRQLPNARAGTKADIAGVHTLVNHQRDELLAQLAATTEELRGVRAELSQRQRDDLLEMPQV